MELTISPSEYRANNKRNILIGIAAWSVASVLGDWITAGSGLAYSLIAILSTVGYVVGLIVWVHADARERNIQLSHAFRIAAVLAGIFALIYYFFRSRGLGGGFIAIGWLVVYIVSLMIILTIVHLILALISDRLGMFA